MRYTLLFLIFQFALLNSGYAQYTAIPDANFEQALIDLGIDSGSIDGKVPTDTIRNITSLSILNKNIQNLTGIQDFTKLISLNCAYNKIASLNINKNLDLESLDISSNQLVTINVSDNKKLKNLYCSGNKLVSLDISANKALKVLDCANNQLSSLVLTNNKALTKLTCSRNKLDNLNLATNSELYSLNLANNKIKALSITNLSHLKTFFCSSNELKSIDLSANDSLDFLDCSNNQIGALDVSNAHLLTNFTASANLLSSIDLSNNDSLEILDCSTNQLRTINLSNNLVLNSLSVSANQLQNIDLSRNTQLKKIVLSQNLITSLDLSNDTALSSLNCSDNQLTTLNLKNSSNQKITLMDATQNPDLRCIEVDNAANANADTNWKKDSAARFTVACVAYTYVPDDNFEQALAAYDDISNDNYVPTANIINLKYLNLDSLGIADLTGIKDFVSLDSLDCAKNKISNLDMSLQPALKKLNCSDNDLYALRLLNGSSALLTDFDARNNPLLTCIQVDDTSKAKTETNWFKDSTANYTIDCHVNKTYIPDIHFEQALIDLGYDKGSIDHYVFTDSIKAIKNLDISNKNIFSLSGISKFINLDSLDCSENNIDTLMVDSLKNLKKLICFGNYLKKLNTTKNTQLLKLNCGNNYLDSLNIRSDTLLSVLYCDANNLTQIDLSLNPVLKELNCNTNYINSTGLDLSKQVLLNKLFCSKNKLTSLNLTNKKSLEILDCSINQLSSIILDSNSIIYDLNCSQNNLVAINLSTDSLIKNLNVASNLISTLNLTKNTFLQSLYCENNLLSSIDISNSDSLRKLSASNNSLSLINTSNNSLLNTLLLNNNALSALNLLNNDSLRVLWCNSNKINVLNTDSNTILQELRCENNQLVSLNFTNNDSLTKLVCSNNNLQKINIQSLLKLKELSANNNQLSDLNTDNNTELESISCSANSIKTLNLSNNTKLKSLNCDANSLSSLIIKNSNNSELTQFNASNNPDLFCIEIDNASAVNSNWKKDAQASFAEFCHYNETYIPDDNFEAALSKIIGESSNNNDNYIPTDSISGLLSLNISNKSISDLTGIQDFIALDTLNLQNNAVDTLDLSQNGSLKLLNCAQNKIDTLSLSQNKNLKNLNFSDNLITQIDLTELNKLAVLDADSNALENLDLSANTLLTSLKVAYCKLLTLDIKNGNNANLTVFDVTNNPDLNCIEVDNPSNANSGSGVYINWKKDENTSFSANCHYGQSYIPDDAFEQSLINMGYDNTGMDDYVPTKKISPITYLDVSNKGILDLTGIADFKNLLTLVASNNGVQKANFNLNPQLKTINLSKNKLSSIALATDSALQNLNLSNNLLSAIDLDSNVLLKQLELSHNQLSSISILKNTALLSVDCSNNQLYSVNANNGANDILADFDLRNNPDLTCILVDDISTAQAKSGWHKDATAGYKLICDDDDNDGIADADDLCPNTPPGDFVDLFGCSIFMLPSDNYNITAYGETCRDGNNGMISISAQKIFNYYVTIIGAYDTISHYFSDQIDIKNLRADSYNMCITIPEQPDYKQCYQVIITQPEELSVYTKMDDAKKNLNIKMAGADSYTVNLNGAEFSTSQNEISLPLRKGENTLIVKTDLECQGTFRKRIFVADKPTVFPNPMTKYLNIYIGEQELDKFRVIVYSAIGKEIINSEYSTNNGLIQINTATFKNGIYYISIEAGAHLYKFRAVKIMTN